MGTMEGDYDSADDLPATQVDDAEDVDYADLFLDVVRNYHSVQIRRLDAIDIKLEALLGYHGLLEKNSSRKSTPVKK